MASSAMPKYSSSRDFTTAEDTDGRVPRTSAVKASDSASFSGWSTGMRGTTTNASSDVRARMRGEDGGACTRYSRECGTS